LTTEAFDEALVVRVLRVQDLESDVAVQLRVLGEIDVGHAADADAARHDVAAGEHARDAARRTACRLRRSATLGGAQLSPLGTGYSSKYFARTSRAIGAAT